MALGLPWAWAKPRWARRCPGSAPVSRAPTGPWARRPGSAPVSPAPTGPWARRLCRRARQHGRDRQCRRGGRHRGRRRRRRELHGRQRGRRLGRRHGWRWSMRREVLRSRIAARFSLTHSSNFLERAAWSCVSLLSTLLRTTWIICQPNGVWIRSLISFSLSARPP